MIEPVCCSGAFRPVASAQAAGVAVAETECKLRRLYGAVSHLGTKRNERAWKGSERHATAQKGSKGYERDRFVELCTGYGGREYGEYAEEVYCFWFFDSS